MVPVIGSWEPSIGNTEPHEELTRSIADFLWREVIMRYETQPADEVSGTMIEIEAKIGQIIDRNTNARVNLPVSTETVMVNDNRCPIQFKSSMTEVRTHESGRQKLFRAGCGTRRCNRW